MFDLKKGFSIFCDENFKIAAEKLSEYFTLLYGLSSEKGGKISFERIICPEEHFKIDVSEEKVIIGASEIKGAIYGASKLIELIDRKNLTIDDICIEEGPFKKMRGVHMYLPARENIEVYKRILDVLVFFKLNTVFIEVSGGMEYEKHPEINKTWEWFCTLARNEFPGPGNSRSLQWADIYWKDSVHPEHAGGSYLLKSEVRDIVRYAKSLGLTVIPEVQALSHSYYLTLAHREIAEAEDDMFPDSYCPLNEKSYELYFDVAEEVIEVFEPEFVSIGHDEVRVLGQCEKCREKTGHELFAYEICRLHEFYKKHGIKIFMWGEMIQYYENYKGVMMGEAVDRITDYGFHYTLPATYEAKYKIPKDITMLDWHYMLSHNSEERFEKDGFRSLFGNFRGSKILNWQGRGRNENLLGAEVSTWVVTDEDTFGRDGLFFEIMFSSHVLWEKDYCDEKYESMAQKVMGEMHITKALMKRSVPPTLRENKNEVIYKGCKENAFLEICSDNVISPRAEIKEIFESIGKDVYGVPIDTTRVLIKNEFYADSILFFHSAKKDMPYIQSYEFPDDRTLGIGTYAVLYEDGTLELANITYGKTIGPLNFEMKLNGGVDANFEIDNDTGEDNKNNIAPTFGHKSEWNGSIVYGTSPILSDNGAIFAYEWENPNPHKKIVKVRAINTSQDKSQSAVLFGVVSVVNKKNT